MSNLHLEPNHRRHLARVPILYSLIAAREVIAKKGWTQGYRARDVLGLEAIPDHSNAVCFCVLGAIDHVQGGTVHYWYDEARALSAHLSVDDPAGLMWWNDAEGRTKEEVLQLYDKAIEEQRKLCYGEPR